jgi:hypothetical protein
MEPTHPTARRQARLVALLAVARACLSDRPANDDGARIALEEAVRIRGVIWRCDPARIRTYLRAGRFAALRRYLCPAASDDGGLFTVSL